MNYQDYREEAGSTQLIFGKDGEIKDIDKETMTVKEQESRRKKMWMSEGEPGSRNGSLGGTSLRRINGCPWMCISWGDRSSNGLD